MRLMLCTSLLAVALSLVGCSSNRRGDGVPTPRPQNTPLADAENEKAYELIKSGRYKEAEQAVQRALDADVLFGPARNNLGLIYYHDGKLYEAAWEFQQAIKAMPYKPEPRNNLGLVFEKAGKYGEAAEEFSKARRIEPDNPEYLSNLARAWMRLGKRDAEMKALLEEVVLKDPRREWSSWARLNLLRLRSDDPNAPVGPATAPAR